MSQELRDRIQNLLDKPLLDLETIDKISHEDFLKNYVKKHKPVKITNMMHDWSATKNWSLDYFEKIGQNKEAYISKGNIRQQETKWEFGNFVDYVKQIRHEQEQTDATYLSNIPIMKLFPELKNDVDFSMLSDHKIADSMSIWIGPKGTITGFHQDRADNILAQVKGSKVWLIVDNSQSEFMYRSNKFEPGSILSEIDLENFDRDKYPLFQKADVYFVEINEGDMVFNPKNSWHCVYSTDTSISVNCMSYSMYDYIEGKIKSFTKVKLHEMGLYGTKDCVCHFKDENGKRIRR
jgi:lysine-specific demethylase 8